MTTLSGVSEGKVANAGQSRRVICDQDDASNLESDGLQKSTQTAITATATKEVNTEQYYRLLEFGKHIWSEHPTDRPPNCFVNSIFSVKMVCWITNLKCTGWGSATGVLQKSFKPLYLPNTHDHSEPQGALACNVLQMWKFHENPTRFRRASHIAIHLGLSYVWIILSKNYRIRNYTSREWNMKMIRNSIFDKPRTFEFVTHFVGCVEETK